MLLTDILILATVFLWVGVCIIYQFNLPGLKAKISLYDIASLSPLYHFFAPYPPQGDYRILVRRRAEDQLSPWTVYDPVPKRKFYNVIWNPFKRLRKGHFDLAIGLCNELRDLEAGKHDAAYIQLTIPYLALTNAVSHHARSLGGAFDEVQFSLSLQNKNAPDESVILFMSRWMSL